MDNQSPGSQTWGFPPSHPLSKTELGTEHIFGRHRWGVGCPQVGPTSQGLGGQDIEWRLIHAISATYPLPKCHKFYASFGDLSTSYRPISFCVIYASRTQVPHKSHTITIQFLYISYTPWHLYSRHKTPPPCSFCTEWMA